MTSRLIAPSILLTLSFGVLGCGSNDHRISAGGATFPEPLIQEMAAEYRTINGVEIDYIKAGSGIGISQTTEKNYDFGCTDVPMTRTETDKAMSIGGEILHIPITMGAVAVIYNLPEWKGPLKLSGPVLTGIYMRSITMWDDPAIAALNPGQPLPSQPITPVARAEASGTTNIFAEYLHKSHPEQFPADMVSKQPKWPQGGIQQEGSDGVTSHVTTNAYSIGYVEVLYAKKLNVSCALLKNMAGKFVGPNTENVTAAAKAMMNEPTTDEPYSLHELTFSLTNAPGEESYPIAGASYAILYKKQPKRRGKAIVEFLKWAATTGQSHAAELEYAPLPKELSEKIQTRLSQVTFE